MNKRSTTLLLAVTILNTLMLFQFVELKAIEHDHNSSARIEQLAATCNIDLDLKECPIQIDEYNKQAANLTTELAYVNSNNTLESFSELQYAEVKYASIISAINSIVNTSNCVIAGMRFFNTLDRDTKSIKIYCSPVYASNPIKSGNYYYFDFNTEQSSLDEIIAAKSIPVYELENGELTDISSNQALKEKASQRWIDYTKYIRIDKTFLPGMRSFKNGNDFYSFFFPLEEFEASQQSANNQATFFIVSSVKKMSGQYYNVINFANVSPSSGVYPIQKAPSSGVDSDYFIGMASNLAQLCPVKCDKLKATKEDGKEIYKLDGNR
jgi:hypothetical protein